MKRSFQFRAKPQCVTPLLITHSISGYKINHLKINMHALSSRCSLLINANISSDVSTLFRISVMNKLHFKFSLCLSTYAQITKTPASEPNTVDAFLFQPGIKKEWKKKEMLDCPRALMI